jgi:hypothetical protein
MAFESAQTRSEELLLEHGVADVAYIELQHKPWQVQGPQKSPGMAKQISGEIADIGITSSERPVKIENDQIPHGLNNLEL